MMNSWNEKKAESPASPSVPRPSPGPLVPPTRASTSPVPPANDPPTAGMLVGVAGRLGDMLVREGVISAAQLREALVLQKEKGGFLGQRLIELGYLKQPTLISYLVKQCKIPRLSLLDYEVKPELFQRVSKEACLKYFLLPIDQLGKILTVAMVDPLDIEALEFIRRACPDLKIKPILCDWEHYEIVSRRVFGSGPSVPQEVTASALHLAPTSTPAKAEPQVPAPNDGLAGPTAGSVDATSVEEPTTPATAGPPLGAIPAAEELSSRLRTDLRDALKEALEPLVSGLMNRVTTPTPPPEDIPWAQDVEEVGATATSNVAHFPSGDAAKKHRPPLTVVSKPERDVLDAIAGPGLRKRSDEQVRSLLDSEETLEAYQFEAFLAGKVNAFPFALSKAVAKSPGRDYNPFFLYGDVGLGKTHLVNAIGNWAQTHITDCRVGYVPASRFAYRLADALATRQLDVFREHYTHWDVLVFDDIHALAGRRDAQEEFSQILDTLQPLSRQIIITANRPLDRLTELEKGLVSRIGGGIVAGLAAPEFETRLEILRHHAGGKPVPEAILALVAKRVPQDVRRMIGAMRKIVAFSTLVEQELTSELAVEILAQLDAGEAA
ncbi:MAG: ATP-binding protein [Candidatus Hydrogenedentes bacterium]|nr:ATP-binding protein [Candidatus Hydrogenedentota bacterium]